MAHNYDIENRNDSSWIFLKGVLDEEAEFPDWNLIQSRKNVAVDLSGLTAMNSNGIREWILWTRAQPKDLLVVDLYGVPGFFLDQATMVRGFLPVDYRIHSFKLQYFCEATQESREKIFHEDNRGQFMVPENVSVSTAAGEKTFEVDHILSKTLRTLETRCSVQDFHKGPFFE